MCSPISTKSFQKAREHIYWVSWAPSPATAPKKPTVFWVSPEQTPHPDREETFRTWLVFPQLGAAPLTKTAPFCSPHPRPALGTKKPTRWWAPSTPTTAILKKPTHLVSPTPLNH
ncbi:hypothetical protein PBY51_001703 [Eleginops maclovinus]|uniref:Uncharacterized protein n=1 Tax=Eleginops maclovinus TaxID=56733 RepID=A0AAN7X0A2_ELEMC|nr:hypothetical protein PBY51_001703 [Eleginops maclovinus]